MIKPLFKIVVLEASSTPFFHDSPTCFRRSLESKKIQSSLDYSYFNEVVDLITYFYAEHCIIGKVIESDGILLTLFLEVNFENMFQRILYFWESIFRFSLLFFVPTKIRNIEAPTVDIQLFYFASIFVVHIWTRKDELYPFGRYFQITRDDK